MESIEKQLALNSCCHSSLGVVDSYTKEGIHFTLKVKDKVVKEFNCFRVKAWFPILEPYHTRRNYTVWTDELDEAKSLSIDTFRFSPSFSNGVAIPRKKQIILHLDRPSIYVYYEIEPDVWEKLYRDLGILPWGYLKR